MENGLRTLRKANGLTQMRLSQKSGVHRTIIARYETGKSGMSSRNLLRVAKALDTSVERIVGGDSADGAAS